MIRMLVCVFTVIIKIGIIIYISIWSLGGEKDKKNKKPDRSS